MSTVIKSIDVDIPASTAFEQWTRFEELPRFMGGVVAVQRLDDRHLHWRAQMIGVERVWELELTEITPDTKIAWRSCSGPHNYGAVVLQPLSTFDTRVTMEVHYDPASFLQEVTDYLGLLSRWVERSLIRFKALAEQPDSTRGHLPPAEELVGQ
jgi:YD repeat-containing protein